MSPALAGRFLTTEPSGKPMMFSFVSSFFLVSSKPTEATVLSHMSKVHSYSLLCGIPPWDCCSFFTHYSTNGHLGCLSLGIL